MITVQIIDHENGTSAIAEIPSEQGPSFRSAITKWCNDQGEVAAGSYKFEKEDAQARATCAVNAFRAAVNRAITLEDPDYE